MGFKYYKRKKKYYFVVSLIILVIAFIGECWGLNIFPKHGVIETKKNIESLDAESGETYTVMRVADGDTFTINTGERVRLIGVDTPESVSPQSEKNVPFGKVVTAFAEEQLLDNEVSLVFDVQREDKYGRLLAYVYLEDGTFYNRLLVEMGYARTMTVPPNVACQELFTKAEIEAKENSMGIWKDYSKVFPE